MTVTNYVYDPNRNGNYSNLNMENKWFIVVNLSYIRENIYHIRGTSNRSMIYAYAMIIFGIGITPEQVGTPEASAIHGYGSRNINELYATFPKDNAALSYDKIKNYIYVTQTNTIRKVDLDNNMFVKTIAGNPWNTQSNDVNYNKVEQTNWNSTQLPTMGNIGIDLSENLYIPIHEYHQVIK